MSEELARLIEEQANDMRYGHRVWHSGGNLVSLDSLFNDNPEYYKPKRSNKPKLRLALHPDDPRHGTHNGYHNLKCRCSRCRIANRLWHREYQARRRNRVHSETN